MAHRTGFRVCRWLTPFFAGSRRVARRDGKRRRASFEVLETRRLLAAEISGKVFHDLNGNGVRDQEESGLANWTVFLDLSRDGAFHAGEPMALTDADGQYRFTGVAAGDYRVAQVLRGGWTPTAPASGYAEIAVVDNQTVHTDFLNQGDGGTSIITGNVWRDLNGDGIQDAGDTGVAGWTVFLDLNGDKVLDPDEPFETTDGNGDYTFTGILGGGVGDAIDYEVQEVLTAGWEPSMGFSENYTAAVVEGQTTVVHDFANSPVEISRVSGVVWNDANGNGVRDAGETGLGGWTVYADLNTNNSLDAGEPSTTTAANGSYTLFGLEPGVHRIAEVQHIDFKPTAPATGFQTVTAQNSGATNNVNFGNQERTDAAIGGAIYADRNRDGMRDPGEEGLPGITVYLDDNGNGLLDDGERSAVTSEDLFYTPDIDEAGTYRFEKLSKGTYRVRQILPAELSGTPETELEHVVTVGPADDRSDIDGGDQYRPSEIHGIKFEDLNGNHSHDSGEPGIEGVTIFLDLNRNNLLDSSEPATLTTADGSYSFTGLEAGAYVVREVVPEGFVQTYPETRDGILWPEGVSNPAVGNVAPTLIQISLAQGAMHTETVRLTLPTTGALTNLVDVFLLFDDTGSFTFNSPIVRAAFPDIISQLQTRLPGIDLGFGVGRLEEYGHFAAENAAGRPFVLNQPIISSDVAGFAASIQAALDHVAPGYGGDRPETVIEALYQMVTGAGFDGDNNGSLLDSGAAGLLSTQINPGTSGDVPPFSSFTPDPDNGVLPASGSVGGAGFRAGALPIIITATDTGFAYQPKGDTTITGIDGLTLPAASVAYNGRGTTPFGAGAGIQETVTGLNALGALVIGLGTNDAAAQDPRVGMETLAKLTGAVNRTAATIDNGTPDPIDPGDPLYFKIGIGGDPLVGNIAEGIVAAVEGAVTAVHVNVTLRASDRRVQISSMPDVLHGLAAGDTATFDVTFTGDGRPHRFDLQFVREGTNVVLGSIPVVIGTPINGDGYEFEDCHDGQFCLESNFGNQRVGAMPNPGATSFFVVDQAHRSTFEYDARGNSLVDQVLHAADIAPRGIAAAADGSVTWVIDSQHSVFVYGRNNALLGAWTATGLVEPEGITVHGDDLWIADRGADSVFRFAGAALLHTGQAIPTSGFNLAPENSNAKDLVTDGSSIWVVDDARQRDAVFRYSMNGDLIGSWQIDAANTKPTGVTIDPHDVNHLWIVDARSDRVYQYDSAAGRSSGEQSARISFRLDSANTAPQGVANPHMTSSSGLVQDRWTIHSPPSNGAVTTWDNIVDPFDADDDGSVEALDALLIINHLNQAGVTNVMSLDVDAPFLDVTADGRVTPIDALTVINALNGVQSPTAMLADIAIVAFTGPPAEGEPSVDLPRVLSAASTAADDLRFRKNLSSRDIAIADFEAYEPSEWQPIRDFIALRRTSGSVALDTGRRPTENRRGN